MKVFLVILGAVFATANAIQLRDISIDEAPACIKDLLAKVDLDPLIAQVEEDLKQFRTTGELDIEVLLSHLMTFEELIFGNQEILDCLQIAIDQNKLKEVVDSIDLVCIMNKIRQEDPHELVQYIDQFISLYHEHGLEFRDIMEVIGAIEQFIFNDTTLGECF